MCTARTKTITTRDGVSISVRDFGNADASRTVVLLHGFCLDQRTWEPHAEELSRDANTRVITYDHRGHGKSDNADISTYTLPHLASDLADVLRALKVSGEVTLAGHSMGGMTILEYMKSSPNILPANILLVATAAGKLSARGVGKVLALPLIGVMRRNPRLVPESLVEAVTRAVFAPILTNGVPRAAYTHGHLPAHARSAARAIAGTAYRTKMGFPFALREFDAYDILPTISAQTLVISGGKDALTPVAHSADMAAGIPHAEHLHFPHAGHMVLHEEFDAVVSAMELMGAVR